MKNANIFLGLFCFVGLTPIHIEAQILERNLIQWEQKKINIGTILEENGEVTAEFKGINPSGLPILITDVITDCGCTTVEFTRDTLEKDSASFIKVKFDPTHRGGVFSKLVIVRTNTDIYGDTLFLEGFNLPLPENNEMAYQNRMGNIGMRLPSVNMGIVFTNEPKVKYIELFNFGRNPIRLDKEQLFLPEYLKAEQFPDSIPANSRGLLRLTYDGTIRNDLGFFEDEINLSLMHGESPMAFKLTATLYEYFPPLPKSLENTVAKLGISETDIDLRGINSNEEVSRLITLSNMGPELLEIRKISTNCECVKIELDKENLSPGEKAQLRFTFNPKGRKGIDHKHITIFSNDPLNPVRTIVVRSSIK
ncbi:hypothetical protein P872_10060 [Rhodonellum psychrophilum GCM71 = DSM 17998]|uniref:DUF1573 domain-containing protein n=2 Tax=Rhodonellum TaxID=336827 RepID=U5BZF6_9BACT|nr:MULTISPECIES: DUF1573 domain-containing protein [Rhodonellum]ERM81287.1 hypothetical protein P872_10060 [Rhodonellum psychrophilum GCM71 = DSM 17998]MDO9554909.1 DUF1573 domain-containing protein [Rhodonellum sp.]SDZ54471.1 protein of unknown function [Rhodonellum ikkaensis]